MTCDGCGNKEAYMVRYSKNACYCDAPDCGNLSPVGVPDVFFEKPYLDPHLLDVNKPSEYNGVWLGSRKEKAARMKELGVHEVGDRVRGARNTI